MRSNCSSLWHAVTLLFILALGGGKTSAQDVTAFNFTAGNRTYTQSFDSLTTDTTQQTLNYSSSSGAAVPGLTGWYAKASGSSGSLNFRADDGGLNAGSLFSYGSASQAEARDRALGSSSTGTPKYITFGAGFANATGGTLSQFTISYTDEEWRSPSSYSSSDTQTSGFYYRVFSASQGNLGNDTYVGPGPVDGSNPGTKADTAWTRFSPLDLTLVDSSNILNSSLNGNTTSKSVTATLNVNVANGQELWIRWLDPNNNNLDAGLAVDNFTISATPAPAGGVSAGLGLAVFGVGAIRRRRRQSQTTGTTRAAA